MQNDWDKGRVGLHHAVVALVRFIQISTIGQTTSDGHSSGTGTGLDDDDAVATGGSDVVVTTEATEDGKC